MAVGRYRFTARRWFYDGVPRVLLRYALHRRKLRFCMDAYPRLVYRAGYRRYSCLFDYKEKERIKRRVRFESVR